MARYSIIHHNQEDNKNETIFTSSCMINTMNKNSDLIHFLKDGYFNDAYLSIDDKQYQLKDAFKLIVNMDQIGTLYFVFIDQEFDLKSLKTRLEEIKPLKVDNDVNKQIKIKALLSIIEDYHPLFAYCLTYLPLIYQVDVKFLFILESENKNQFLNYFLNEEENDEKNIKEKLIHNKKKDNTILKDKKPNKGLLIMNKIFKTISHFLSNTDFLFFISSFLLMVGSQFTAYLIDIHNYLYLLTIILALFGIAMISRVTYEFYQNNHSNHLFIKQHLDALFFAFIGLLLSITLFILLAKYAIKIEANNKIFIYAMIGTGISIALVGLITLTYYLFIKNRMNKSKKK